MNNSNQIIKVGTKVLSKICNDKGAGTVIGSSDLRGDNHFDVLFSTGDKIAKHLIDTYSKRGTIVKENNSLTPEDYNIYKIPFLKNKNVILAHPNEMFANKNVVEITHGGISAEELIVPFVELKDRKIK